MYGFGVRYRGMHEEQMRRLLTIFLERMVIHSPLEVYGFVQQTKYQFPPCGLQQNQLHSQRRPVHSATEYHSAYLTEHEAVNLSNLGLKTHSLQISGFLVA